MKNHQIIILDRSGSMEACRDATISGFNELAQTVAKAAKEAESDLRVTLVVFNHEVACAAFCQQAEALAPLTPETYVPDGMTAMLDAVGQILGRFEAEVPDDGDTRYLVTIVSDGEENSSSRFSYETVAEMIQKRRSTGRWTFAYMGANQDLSVVAERLHIPRGNTASYVSSSAGTALGFGRLAMSSSCSVLGLGSPDAFFGGASDGPSESDARPKKPRRRRLH